MEPTGEIPSIAAAVGRRVRDLRQEAGARQQDVAMAARRWGLAWSQSSVATLESGGRDLSLGEFAALLPTMSLVLGRTVNATDLLDGDDPVRLTPDCVVPGGLDDVWGTFIAERVPAATYQAPQSMPAEAVDAATAARVHRMYETVWRTRTRDYLSAESTATDDAEQKAARKLNVPAEWIAVAAHSIWGHGLTFERDRLVDVEAGSGADPRTVQARRGHVTRSLLRQIAPVVEAIREANNNPRG